MKLYDISKEIFSAAVFPGDPAPAFQPTQRLAEGGHCNLTQVTLGTHSATHMDAPWHFVPGGKTIDQVQQAGWDVGVAWQDGRAFHGPCHIRMNLALPLSRVQEAFDRLQKYVFVD